MRIRSSIVLIGMMILFPFCKTAGDDPVAIVKSFVKAIDNRDFQKAGKLVMEGYKQHLEEMKKKSATLPAKIIVYTYTLREKKDSNAIVDLLVPSTENIPETSLQVHLKKIKNKWLIESIF
jgi:hypothetical protein